MDGGFEHLLDEGIITEVIARLKSGKEADVYIVRYGGRVVAAKVYKDRATRSFKNNSAYKEGRTVRNSRSQRAMTRKTAFGQAAAEEAWKSAEADALYKLHAADVRVPTPVMFLDGVLLMELVLGADGDPAPRIIDTPLTIPEANAAYRDMLTQLVRILACDLIHGDLSPYNVLWGATGPTIIDFPQIISASHNSSSETFFVRDARNILGHFASIDRSLNARSGDAHEIWRAYVRRELTPDFVPTGRSQPIFARPARRFEPRPNPPAHAPAQTLHQGARGNSTHAHRPETHRPDAHRPDAHRPDAHRPDAHRPDARPPMNRGNAAPQNTHSNARPNAQSNPRPHSGGPHSGGHAGPSSRRSVHVPEVIVRPNRSGPASSNPHTPPQHEAPPRHNPPPRHSPPRDRPMPAQATNDRGGSSQNERGDDAKPTHRRRRRRH